MKTTKEKIQHMLDFGLTRSEIAHMLGNVYSYGALKISGHREFTDKDDAIVDYYYKKMMEKQAAGTHKLTKDVRHNIILDWLAK